METATYVDYGYIQLLTDINIDIQLYTGIYSCLHTLESANSYIHGLQVYTILTDILNIDTQLHLYTRIYSCIRA